MNNGLGCGCGTGNWWGNMPQSVCGKFELPEVEDLGQCSSHNVKITCEAPVLPVAQCNDLLFSVVYTPANAANPFSIFASLFNECCLALTDQTGSVITLIINQMAGAPNGVCP